MYLIFDMNWVLKCMLNFEVFIGLKEVWKRFVIVWFIVNCLFEGDCMLKIRILN